MIAAIGQFSRNAVASAVLAVAISGPVVAAGPALPAPEAQVVPHRAVYSMSLASAKNSSGVIAAHGALAFEWGDSCDGWTIEQRYKLQLVFAQDVEVEITTNYITWESKDGTAYRFTVRKTKNGKPEEEISGSAELDGTKGGTADFRLPAKNAMKLPAGTIFPTQHTLLLLERARAGDRMVPRVVFDGATAEGASLVSALIGRALPAPDTARDPLLKRPGWTMHMAYFGINKANTAVPDYEIGMELQDNGVARGIRLDYTDFSIKGTLEELELLQKPPC